MNTANVAFLRRLPLFAGLSQADLEWLADCVKTVSIPAGEWLMEEGSPSDGLYVVLEGDFEVILRPGGQDVVVAVRGPGEVLGEMSLFEGGVRTASVRAACDGRLLKLAKADFVQFLLIKPLASLAMMRTVNERLRSSTAMLRQSEKEAALGALAAGLAHELNNPASAVLRHASRVRGLVDEYQQLTSQLCRLGLSQDQWRAVERLRAELEGKVEARSPSPESDASSGTNAGLEHTPQPVANPLRVSDLENELEGWLEQRGVTDAWEIAPFFVGCNWDIGRIQALSGDFGDQQLAVVLGWLARGCMIQSLVGEVGRDTERMSRIVKAVKDYAFLDQAPIQEVEVHRGLDDTLVVLADRLRPGVRVTRNYDPNLPRIEARGRELNQVWTNVIDHAITAMNGRGELGIRTYRQDDCVVVEVLDMGPGISPDDQRRIFDPLPVDLPSDVGSRLHISYNIVRRHGGAITVESRPGETRRRITLPIRLGMPRLAAADVNGAYSDDG